MIVPEIFKYFSIISMPLFMIIAFLLIKKLPDFSFSKHTISKTALFIKDPFHMFIFRLNFIIKTLLDLGFVWYLIFRLKISFGSSLSWLLILSTLLFSLLAYFLVGRHTFIHRIIIYGYGVLWAIIQILLAQMTGNLTFIFYTNLLSISTLVIAFGYLFAEKTNVFVQAVCIVLLYSWLLIFIFKYL